MLAFPDTLGWKMGLIIAKKRVPWGAVGGRAPSGGCWSGNEGRTRASNECTGDGALQVCSLVE